jgi:putative membrane protein
MLASSLLIAFGIYGAGVARLWTTAGAGKGVSYWRAGAFAAGWAALAAALSPRMDEWSDTWLSVHMVQHEMLIVVAAPLMALGAPLVATLWALPAGARRALAGRVRNTAVPALWGAATAPGVAMLLHAVALWTWHLPRLYDYAVAHDSVHVLEHLSFFVTAAVFWWAIANGRYGRSGYGAAVVYVFATGLHSGLLGALLTFSPRVWFAAYAMPHGAGLSPLEDQQLAGLLMWVPAGFLLVVGALVFFAAWLRESERRVGLGCRATTL